MCTQHMVCALALLQLILGCPCAQDAHRQRTIDWIDATGGRAAAFDFTTKGVLQEAVARNHYWRLRDAAGKPPGVLGWWPSHAVTFVEVRWG